MKKLFLLLVLTLLFVLNSNIMAQSNYIFYSDNWVDKDNVSGYNNVKLVFNFDKNTYYKVVEGQKNPTYKMLSYTTDYYNGQPFIIINLSKQKNGVSKIIIMNGNVSEYFWSGFWQIFYCYNYESY